MKWIGVVIVAVMMSGCLWCEPEIRERVITETKIVKVEVPCNVPKVGCDLGKGGVDTSHKMIECIIEQKRAMEVCSE
jgi:hypothetical protein